MALKILKRIYYKLVPTYKRVDFTICTWEQGDKLIKSNPEWRIAKEDAGLTYPIVALEIRERVME